MKQGILFDLDGTLWDSAQAVVDSWNEIIETLPDFHKLITNEDMCQLMGKTMDDVAYTYFNTVSKERALEILQICMDHENAYIEQHGGVLFPGLEEVLKELSEDKFETRLSDLMRPILSFNEDDSVYQIWEKMLEKREHISIILDEYGCLRGVVSMEDVIETMTGVEIVDEDDVAVDMQAFAKEKSRRMAAKAKQQETELQV